MFFQPKSIVGCIIVLGIGISSYSFSVGSCSSPYIIIPWDSELGSTNSILDCKNDSDSRNYSVYLVFKGENRAALKQEATFQVIDNKTKKIVWGPESESSSKWDRWGIQVFYEKFPKESPSAEKKITEIRVPKKTKWAGGTDTIRCQKSMVQMKKGEEGSKCTGTFLQSKNMNFEIKPQECSNGWFGKKTCNINLVKKMEWNTNFQPKGVVCNY